MRILSRPALPPSLPLPCILLCLIRTRTPFACQAPLGNHFLTIGSGSWILQKKKKKIQTSCPPHCGETHEILSCFSFFLKKKKKAKINIALQNSRQICSSWEAGIIFVNSQSPEVMFLPGIPMPNLSTSICLLSRFSHVQLFATLQLYGL